MSTMCVLTVTLRLILNHREAIIYQKTLNPPKSQMLMSKLQSKQSACLLNSHNLQITVLHLSCVCDL